MFEAQCVVILGLVVTIRCDWEGYIVGGDVVKEIEQFPYSALLTTQCPETTTTICGASILNQDVVLTAAHCINHCERPLQIGITVGSVLKRQGFRTMSQYYVYHYLSPNPDHAHDIGLVRTKNSIPLNDKASRVALTSKPPLVKIAQVAGWGYINEQTLPQRLMYGNQIVWTRQHCEKILNRRLEGRLCAINPRQYIAHGDSGSALVIKGYTQIGLVSCGALQKVPGLSIYTDVSYYVDWISHSLKEMFCLNKK